MTSRPKHIPRFYALWAINGPLDERRLCRQLDQMRAFGLDGAVFHPRFYPNEPAYLGDAYMKVLSGTILYAKSIGLDLWIYDEDGWPSGTVSGELLKRYPQDGQQWANLVLEEPRECLGSFEHGGKRWYVAREVGKGVDYFSSRFTQHFLSMTHDRYRQGLEPGAWDHVSTIFCDEPEFGLGHAFDALSRCGAIPWTAELPEIYQRRYGDPIASILPLIFFPGEGSGAARVRFWELLTDLFVDSFISPIDQWCAKNGKRFTAHIKGEEHPLFQVPMVGSCNRIFRHLSLPGIDALERFPSNDYFPRQATSAAAQFGDGRCMAECFGGAGWARAEDFERYILWLGRNGITDYVIHLWQYHLDSAAIRDWPASIPNHIGWRDVFAAVLRGIKLKLSVLDVGTDTVVVSPHRAIMASYQPRELLRFNIHNAATYEATTAGAINRRFLSVVADAAATLNPHYVDERTFEEATIDQQELAIGQCKYRRVIVGEDCLLTAAGKSLLAEAKRLGVAVETVLPIQRDDSQILVIPPRPRRGTVSPKWFAAPQQNAMPLDPLRIGPDRWRATFLCSQPVPLKVRFADQAISRLTLNGEPLAESVDDEGTTARVEETRVQTVNTIEFTFATPTSGVSAWLLGVFWVECPPLPVPVPNGTVELALPFRLAPGKKMPVSDLVEAGFAFSQEGVVVESEPMDIDLAGAAALRFFGAEADQIRVELDGTDLGYAWGPQWTVNVPTSLARKAGRLRLRLHPSAFNRFGPNRYFNGDQHLISPMQYSGVRGFADPPGAPENTITNRWFVRPLRCPDRIDWE